MRSKLSVLGGHPVHVMIVHAAMGAFPLLLVLDVVARFQDAGALWTAGFYVSAFGFLVAGLAVLTGVVDLAAIPDGIRAHRIATIHFVVGLTILGLYGLAAYLRYPAGSPPSGLNLATVVSLLGNVGIAAQGWLGGELVVRHQLGVLNEEQGAEPVDLG